MLTHGHITRVLEYLSWLRRGRIQSLRDYLLLSRCTRTELVRLEEFCDACRMTRVSHDVTEELTPLGAKIADDYILHGDVQIGFRNVLEQYIRTMRPVWANRMPVGRQETFSALNGDQRFCFREAGLANDPIGDSAVEWWDRIAADFRSQMERDLLAVGRKGERLTIQYERRRTGRTPKWMSIETNFAGYDILSIEECDTCAPRRIEVKASELSLEHAEFSISRNEWEVACCPLANYYFYLWLLNPHSKIAVVTAQEVGVHIAANRGAGQWKSIVVPYSAFHERFENFNC